MVLGTIGNTLTYIADTAGTKGREKVTPVCKGWTIDRIVPNIKFELHLAGKSSMATNIGSGNLRLRRSLVNVVRLVICISLR